MRRRRIGRCHVAHLLQLSKALLGRESKESEVVSQFNSKRNQLNTASVGMAAASGMSTRRIRVFLGSSFRLRKAGVKVRVVCVERRREDGWREPGLLAKLTRCPAGPQGAHVPLGRQAQRLSLFHLGLTRPVCSTPGSTLLGDP